MKTEIKYATPEELLHGSDLSQDLRYLIGYIWTEGNQNRTFPTTHFNALVDFFINKYDIKGKL